ncbi:MULTISPECIES: GNAT family N-acetyltransferase [Rhizobium]|uniref:Ribosomal-protein-alanine N-acetyltransferase n=1 Tax=Rhizobium wenxiniae TaxID=1737357 RepID=A0A7X0CZF6_9HYPH|nr:GNAT family N-acetyltransferase [Rhizobium wenxiniae]MBB6162295.1 ribosomal-protein-alanine N-acetyltransferase [Rhizobium wenxiniae]GGF99728.1 alanine acetyltransferase [Rhizobium wenxiniae]
MQPISTERTLITLVRTDDAEDLRTYYLRNTEHLARWEPLRLEDYHSVDAWKDRARDFAGEALRGFAYRYVVRFKGSREIIAVANFTNVVRGAFLACHLGYSIDSEMQGKNIMFEVLDTLIPHVFNTYGLHRVMANYIPENARSGALLARLGFEVEGRARDYLKINGEWRDHVLTARINDAR